MRWLLIVLLLLVACNGDPEYPKTDKDYKTGTDGLKFDFLPNAPPDSVFEEGEFEILSEIWNKGAYTITKGYITAIVENEYMCITENGQCVQTLGAGTINPGISRDIVQLEPAGYLEGKRVASPEGNAKHMKFTAKARQLDLLSVQHTSPIILTSCYLYLTELAQDICIDPNPTSQSEKVCNVGDISLSDQGAPLAITLIETRMIPDGDNTKPQFLIHVKNKGIGQVVHKDKMEEACSSNNLYREDFNRLVLSEFRFSNDKYVYKFGGTSNNIDCGPNPLKLADKEDFIRCTVKESVPKATAPFTTQAYVKFEYGYTHSISKNIIIEKVG